MRSIKNEPGKYLNRSNLFIRSLAGDSRGVLKLARSADDFSSAEIDSNFFVIFLSDKPNQKPK